MDHPSLLRQTFDLARKARQNGNHPFGALLADAHGNVVMAAENTVETEGDCTGHAELNLVRLASIRYRPAELAQLTLYTSTEPCAMCAGAIYWSGIGKVVYGLSEEGLRDLTGNHPQNPTLSLPCREVFARGQRAIEVIGPLLEHEAQKVHTGFWQK